MKNSSLTSKFIGNACGIFEGEKGTKISVIHG